MLIIGIIICFLLMVLKTAYDMHKMFNTRQAVGAPFYKETFD